VAERIQRDNIRRPVDTTRNRGNQEQVSPEYPGFLIKHSFSFLGVSVSRWCSFQREFDIRYNPAALRQTLNSSEEREEVGQGFSLAKQKANLKVCPTLSLLTIHRQGWFAGASTGSIYCSTNLAKTNKLATETQSTQRQVLNKETRRNRRISFLDSWTPYNCISVTSVTLWQNSLEEK
jgi:hypothetical protein